MSVEKTLKRWRDIRIGDAEAALRENLVALDPVAHKAAHNLSVALMGICSELRNVRSEIEFVNTKLGPVLRELSDDQDDVRRIARKR